MDAPPVHYVKTADGYDIGYTVSGEGYPFVFLPGWTNHVQEVWQDRLSIGPLLRALAERFQVVNYDARGMGLSTRSLPANLTLDSYVLDLEAVLTRLDLDRFILLGTHSSALLAGHYAARHPERVSALILANSGPSWLGVHIPSLWDDLPRESWETFLYTLVLYIRIPERFGEKAARAIAEGLGKSTSQAAYLASIPVWRSAGLEQVARRIQTPTLVLRSKYCPCTPAEGAMELACFVPNARLVLLESDLPFGEPGQAIQAIDGFLEEVGEKSDPQRDRDGALSAAGTLGCDLSPRQLQVLQLIAAGNTSREIAEALVLSERTVQRHIAGLYAKTGVRNRAEATAYALNLQQG